MLCYSPFNRYLSTGYATAAEYPPLDLSPAGIWVSAEV